MGARRNEILIAVDGSPASVWAIRTGIKLAGEMDAAVTLLHVVIPPVVGINEATLAMAENLFAEAKAAGEAILEAARRHLPPTMPARTVLREGFPAQEILSQARETGAGLHRPGHAGRRAVGTLHSRQRRRRGDPGGAVSGRLGVPRPGDATDFPRGCRAVRTAAHSDRVGAPRRR